MTACCTTCGFPIEGRRRDARHCSDACKQKSYRDRRNQLERPLRIARLRAQIKRDDRIAWEHAVPFAIQAVPGLVIHRCYGVGFPALGRKRQAERLLRRLDCPARCDALRSA